MVVGPLSLRGRRKSPILEGSGSREAFAAPDETLTRSATMQRGSGFFDALYERVKNSHGRSKDGGAGSPSQPEVGGFLVSESLPCFFRVSWFPAQTLISVVKLSPFKASRAVPFYIFHPALAATLQLDCF